MGYLAPACRAAANICLLMLTMTPTRLSADPVTTSEVSLLRASLIVADASASIRFYERLGFQIELDQANPRQPVGNPFPLNVPAQAVRLVILGSATGAGGRIGLVEFSSPTPNDNRIEAQRTGRGDVVLVFDVTDAEAIHARLKTAGVNILEPPQIYRSRRKAPDGSAMEGRVFHVRDPDGYLIELLEAPKSVK